MLRTWSAVDECEPLGSQAPASARPLVKTLSRSSSHAFTVSSSSCASLLSDDDNDTNNNTMDNNYDHHHNNSSNDSHEPAPLDSNDDNQRALSFQDENERLRRQVADLESALVVRDMELATLQERCHFLLTSVETQDEVIAKIYAATAATEALPGGPRSRRSSSAPVSTPTSLSASVDAQRQRRVHSAAGVRALFSSSSQERRPRGAVPTLAPPTKPTKPNKKNLKSVTAEPAHELLEAQLDSIGYEPQRATDALESLVDGPPLLTRTNSVASVGERTRVGQLDELLFPPPPTSASLFGSTDASPSSGAVTSPSPSLDVRVAKSGDFRQSPFVERQSSLPRDEDFAQSAGFLRKANRKLSGRLSVSDFGLLSDDTALFARSSSSEQSELAGSGEPENDNDDDNNDDGASDISDAAGKRRQRRTASQRNLFAEIDVAASEAAKRKKNQHQQQTSSGAPTREHEPSELTYAEFLERISLPASRDILHRIRLFVGSVLGPRGDGKPPRSTDYVDYDFYGPHEFQRRYEQFFRKIDATLAAHPAWRHATETTLVKARDGVEKYVMDKLSDLAFTQLPVCAQWKADDDRLFRRMKLLSFVTPDMLDINPCMRNEVVWSMAEDELRRINSFRAPSDKINCIVRCCSVIFSVLSLARGDSGNRPGADDFLPVFIYIVLHAQIPRLCSNCEYIAAYRNPADLMSKAGYCFVNLRSAIEFINVLDASMLSISPDEFERLLSERERLVHEQSGVGRR